MSYTTILILTIIYIVPIIVLLYIKTSYDRYFQDLHKEIGSRDFDTLYNSWPKYKQHIYDELWEDRNFFYDSIIFLWFLAIPLFIIYKIIGLPIYIVNYTNKKKIEEDIKLLNLYNELNKDGKIVKIEQIRKELKNEI